MSVLYCFSDDKNANGLIDFLDDFVTAEYLMAGTNATLLTLSRQKIASPSAAQSYGLASVNYLNQSSAVFFTGEPDGQVFAWIATGSTNPLQRQLFSAQYAGKAWHALAGVKALEPGEGLAGLLVDPATPNKCDVILWPPQPQLPQLLSPLQTAPLARILPAPNTGGTLATVRVRVWDAEGNAALPFLQYQRAGTTYWLDATLVSADGSAYSPATRVATLPTGLEHDLVWNAGHDLGAGFTNSVLLRARASDVTLTGEYSATVPYHVETPSLLRPVVNMLNPLAGAAYLRGDTIPLAAYAFGVAGPVVTVEFLSGTQSLGRLTNGVYLLNWTNAPVGTNILFALATDSLGTTNLSSGVTISVRVPGRITNTLATVSGQVRLSLHGGDHSRRYRIDSSTNLINWATLSTVTNTNGAAEFREPISGSVRNKFYRVVLVQ